MQRIARKSEIVASKCSKQQGKLPQTEKQKKTKNKKNMYIYIHTLHRKMQPEGSYKQEAEGARSQKPKARSQKPAKKKNAKKKLCQKNIPLRWKVTGGREAEPRDSCTGKSQQTPILKVNPPPIPKHPQPTTTTSSSSIIIQKLIAAL
jgi:hypothetical protein